MRQRLLVSALATMGGNRRVLTNTTSSSSSILVSKMNRSQVFGVTCRSIFGFKDDNKETKTKVPPPTAQCGDDDSDDEEDEMEQMFVMGPSVGQMEWGGPTRGGKRPEPTRYGDWERKGRATDF